MEILEEIVQHLRKGDERGVVDSVNRGLQQGLNWEVVLSKGLFAGMEIVGKLFKEEDMFVPEVIMSAKAMNAGMKILEPLMTGKEAVCKKGTVILGTVKGDIHDLGKSLVAMMLMGAGFEVIDIGAIFRQKGLRGGTIPTTRKWFISDF
jgi:5-methyltetrahydrofolate--homocysteine methyltransferase